MTASQIDPPAVSPKTFWERPADTRWGNYITKIERETLLAAANSFNEPGTGLEVGCEGGPWTRMLSDLGWQMTATDVDPRVLAVCRERNPSAGDQ